MRRDQISPDGGRTTDIEGGYSLDPDAELADSGVTPGSYGLAGSVPVFTVDAKGRISTAASVAIAIAESQVTGLTADLAIKAPLASPALTGIPTAPTAAPGTNTAQVSTTAFVAAAIAALVASSPATLDTLNELAVALGNDPNFATTMATALGLKAVDTAVLHKTGAESATGVKTFSSGINLGAADLTAYAEGTWIPVVAGSTTPGTHTYYYQKGSYTRVGRLVICQFSLYMASKDAAMAGSQVRITGLPFTAENVASQIHVGGVSGDAITYPAGTTALSLTLAPNTNYLVLSASGSAMSTTDVPVSALGVPGLQGCIAFIV